MFNKDIFKKKYDILELKSYDLTEELSILEEKNNKIDKIRNKMLWGSLFGIAIPSAIIPLAIASSVAHTNPFIVLILLGIFSPLIIIELPHKIPLFSSFKNINRRENEAIEKIALLCKEENFQFEILSYLKKNIDKLYSVRHNKSAEFYSQLETLQCIYQDLVECFSHKKFLEASKILTCRENIYLFIKINKKLIKIKEVKTDISIEQYQLKLSGYLLNENPDLEGEKEYEYKNYL